LVKNFLTEYLKVEQPQNQVTSNGTEVNKHNITNLILSFQHY